MSCENNSPVTNDTAASNNYKIRRGDAWVFGFSFFEDEPPTIPMDVSTIEFKLSVVTASQVESLIIENGDWARDATNHIQKYYPSFLGLAKGKYSYELVATHPDQRIQTMITGQINVF